MCCCYVHCVFQIFRVVRRLLLQQMDMSSQADSWCAVSEVPCSLNLEEQNEEIKTFSYTSKSEHANYFIREQGHSTCHTRSNELDMDRDVAVVADLLRSHPTLPCLSLRHHLQWLRNRKRSLRFASTDQERRKAEERGRDERRD